MWSSAQIPSAATAGPPLVSPQAAAAAAALDGSMPSFNPYGFNVGADRGRLMDGYAGLLQLATERQRQQHEQQQQIHAAVQQHQQQQAAAAAAAAAEQKKQAAQAQAQPPAPRRKPTLDDLCSILQDPSVQSLIGAKK